MTRIQSRNAAAALALTALTLPLLAACASTGSTGSTGSAAGPGAGASSAAKPAAGSSSGAGSAAAAVTTIDGKRVAVPGKVPVALVFISIGCADCASAAASAAQAQHALGARVTVLDVDLDQGVSPSDLTSFLSQIGASGPSAAIDPALATTYRVAALSTVLVIDPAGHVTYQAVAPSAGDIEAALTKAGA